MFQFHLMFDTFKSFAVQVEIMLITAVLVYGAVQLAKYLLDKKGIKPDWKAFIPLGIIVISLAIYWIISKSFLDGFMNSIILYCLSASMNDLLSALWKAIQKLIEWIKSKVK